ncbi:MAG: 5-(carboxyamino)imidazole ribonucleotide synthase [Actinomycetota bacterium]
MRVGIVGGGQLGRMLALAGHDIGIACATLDPTPGSPAAQVAPAIVGAYDDRDALLDLAERSDVVTYEFENVPVASARLLAERGVRVAPPSVALEVAQDRLAEKTLFTEIGLPVPMFAAVEDLASLQAAIDAVGLPAVLKTRRLGYDGKGQAVLHHRELAEDAWRSIGEVPAILEAFVPFDRELSILGARDERGRTAFWPLMQNQHRDGILRLSEAPAPGAGPALQADAERHATALMERLGYVGVLAIELFETAGGLQGNEFAPRVHNSGHWTIEGSETSQFEQHLRAVCGLPLGPVDMRGCAAMINLVGALPRTEDVLAIPGAHLHLYGKEPRPGRKVGHVTIRTDQEETLRRSVVQVRALLADA